MILDPQRFVGRVYDGRRGLGALVTDQLLSLLRHRHALPPTGAQSERVLDGTLELLGAALSAQQPDCALPRNHLLEVREWIDDHLDDPRLSPLTVAEAHGVSVRTCTGGFSRRGHRPRAGS